jgi:hypothetical protein
MDIPPLEVTLLKVEGRQRVETRHARSQSPFVIIKRKGLTVKLVFRGTKSKFICFRTGFECVMLRKR